MSAASGSAFTPARLGHAQPLRAPAGADQIRALLAQGIPACVHCRPDTALGVLE
ncbi:DUF6233 domain-containing protein [Streptomyces goshikiensis]|uniref:DUF6233 domain-containing protein n=1 Tax=Streptomyces goshikiensis TaxID=1942 RepID=UPI0033A92415